ncbi:MAG: PAS domain S-box protein [Candidatus Binatia bacterium]
MSGTPEAEPDETDVLRGRVRLAARMFLGSLLVFGVADLWLAPGVLASLYTIKLIGLVVAVAVLRALPRLHSRRALVAVAVAAVASAMLLIALSGITSGDVAAVAVLCVVMLVLATTLPWGMAAQAVVAAFGLGSVVLHARGLGEPLGYPAVAALVCAAMSIYLAGLLIVQLAALRTERSERWRSEERFRDLLERSTDLIQSVDPAGRLLYANEAWRCALRYGEAEVRGRPILEVMEPVSRDAWTAAFEAALRGEAVEDFEARLCARDGTVVHVQGSVTPQIADGQPISVRGIFRDITVQRVIEGALRTSERRFEMMLQHVSDVIALVDPEGVIRYVSPSCERVLGFTPSELIGRPAGDLTHVDDLPGVVAAFQAAVPHGMARAEYRHRTADGDWIEVETTGTVLNDDPDIRGTVLCVRDVSERRAIEQALLDSEQRFRATFAHAALGIAHVSPDGHWLRVNRRLCEIVGYSAEEMLGRTFQDITHPDDLGTDLEFVRQMLAGLLPSYAMEKRYVRKDGSLVWGHLTVALVREASGTPAYFIAVIEDIGDRKRAEARVQALNEELRERSRALEEASREMEAFSYSVSHDLRAPLRAIEGFNRILIEDFGAQLAAEGRQYLERVGAASLRMQQLIDDLLLLGQVTRREVCRRAVDVSALVRDVVREVSERLPERRPEVLVGDGVEANADPNLLRILFENLFDNAWKYTARRRPGRIEFGVARRAEGPALFVRDDGAGFDMAYAERLFRPFQRLHSNDEFEGTGIGLAIVERIVRRHGGRVWAEATPEQGATFYFTLAAGAADDHARLDAVQSTGAADG